MTEHKAADPRDARFLKSATAQVANGGLGFRLSGIDLSLADLLRSAGRFDKAYQTWVQTIWGPEQRSIVNACLVDKTSRERFSTLTKKVEHGGIVAFVGSGLCVPYGYPIWKDFLNGLLKWTEKISSDDLEKQIRTAGYEDAASSLSEAIHSKHWNEQLASEFSAPSLEKLECTVAPIQWLPLISSRIAVTTNYDPILEAIYSAAGKKFEHIILSENLGTFRELKTHSERCLLKIHGDHRQSKARVLTRKDYDNAYSRGSEARSELELLFRYNSLLFLGCSLSIDRTMDVLFEIAKSDSSMPKHYAFMRRPPEDSEWLTRDRFLIERNIYTIWYPQEHNVALEGLLGTLALEAKKLEGENGPTR